MSTNKYKIGNRVGFINRKTYNEFIKKYPESGISYETYIKVLKKSNTLIKEFILSHELGFKLPYNLGYLAVNKFKQKENYVVTDWKNSIRLKKFVPLTNLHSFGYMYKIQFFKNKGIRPLEVYFAQAHRNLKRELAQRIKQGKQNYMELDYSYFNKRFHIDNIIKSNK